MKPALLLAGVVLAAPLLATDNQPVRTHFLIIGGLGGEPSYVEEFEQQVNKLEEVASGTVADPSAVRSLSRDQATRENLEQSLAEMALQMGESDRLALFLLGHGTFDGHEYKFNIKGPDLTASQLSAMLDSLPAKHQLVVIATSASGAALDRLKAAGRIVITATKTGRERNASVFGRHFVEGLASEEADTDKSETITALEAFVFAERKTSDYYEQSGRLATEHSRLQGDLAGSFTLARLGTALEVFRYPELAEFFAQRDRLERQIGELKLRKQEMDQDAYYDRLEVFLIGLAKAQREIDSGVDLEPPQ